MSPSLSWKPQGRAVKVTAASASSTPNVEVRLLGSNSSPASMMT